MLGSMRRRRTALLVGGGALLTAGLWTVALLSPPDRVGQRATALAVAAQLDAFVTAHRELIEELAERFSQWETMPAPALLDALRAAASRHLALRQILVADPAGRLLAGYDADRPPGREAMAPGSLDQVLARRQVLRGEGSWATTRSRAGLAQRLEMAAPIRSADGTRSGYVGASVSLDVMRDRLGQLAGGELSIWVSSGRGALIFPCHGDAPTRGVKVRSGDLVVTVARRSKKNPWLLMLASAFTLMIFGLWLSRSLDRAP